MKAVIRLAKLSDAVALAQFSESSFRETFLDDNLAENIDMHCLQSFSPEIQQEEISNSNFVTLITEIGDKLVGFAQLRLQSSVECIKARRPIELYRLYVSAEQQGHGLAHQIMQEVIGAAVKSRCDCIWLGVWEHNPRAVAFYQKYDFNIVGEHVFKLGEDPQRDFIMSKDMSKSI